MEPPISSQSLVARGRRDDGKYVVVVGEGGLGFAELFGEGFAVVQGDGV
jgi:hypothetical protein